MVLYILCMVYLFSYVVRYLFFCIVISFVIYFVVCVLRIACLRYFFISVVLSFVRSFLF